jgi:hypothetical protein
VRDAHLAFRDVLLDFGKIDRICRVHLPLRRLSVSAAPTLGPTFPTARR